VNSTRNSPSLLSRIPFREIILCATLAFAVLLPLSPLVQHFPFRDSGAFLYAGWRIREGEAPYAGFWDHKPPLIYFIDAAGLTLGNGSVWGVWALEWVSLFITCWLAYRLLRKAFPLWPSGISLCLMLGVFSILVLGGNLTTEFALPLQFACLYLASQMEENKTGGGRMFLLGVLCACLFSLKQNLVGIPIVVAGFRFLSLWRANQKKSAFGEIGGFAAGAGLVILPLLAYLAARNALGAFWSAAFQFNRYYAETGLKPFATSAIHNLEAVSQAGLGILGLIGWTAGAWLWMNRDDAFRAQGAWLKAAWIALPADWLMAALPGHYEIHYSLSLLPTFAVFAALALWTVYRGARLEEASSLRKFVSMGILIAFLFAVSAYPLVTTAGAYRTNDWSDVAGYIRANSSPDDTVLFWGAESGLNFLIGRRSPSRFAYLYPLYTKGYVRPEDLSEFLGDLQEDPPLWIVDTKNPQTPFLDFPLEEAEQDALREWFFNNYSEAEAVHGWTFYRWKGE
jgi:hypothetical protein